MPTRAHGKKKKGVHQRLHCKVAILCAHHKKKPSAAIATQMCADFLRVLNDGSVPVDCDAEYIEGGERLPGGTAKSRDRPLDYGLRERSDPEPYAEKRIEQWWRRRDRCAAQFQGARAFKGV